jgi:hypothetical protein
MDKITIVYASGTDSENDVVLVYKGEKRIGYLAPAPRDSDLEAIIATISGEKADTLYVEQPEEVDDYPKTLSAIKKWESY